MQTVSSSKTLTQNGLIVTKRQDVAQPRSLRVFDTSFARSHFLGILNVCREMDMAASEIYEIVIETMEGFYTDDSMGE